MHLGLGPVALVSILTGQVVLNYGIDYTTNPQDVVDFTGEAALAVGTIFAVLSLFNLGELITYISHPVKKKSNIRYFGLFKKKNL